MYVLYLRIWYPPELPVRVIAESICPDGLRANTAGSSNNRVNKSIIAIAYPRLWPKEASTSTSSGRVLRLVNTIAKMKTAEKCCLDEQKSHGHFILAAESLTIRDEDVTPR